MKTYLGKSRVGSVLSHSDLVPGKHDTDIVEAVGYINVRPQMMVLIMYLCASNKHILKVKKDNLSEFGRFKEKGLEFSGRYFPQRFWPLSTSEH